MSICQENSDILGAIDYWKTIINDSDDPIKRNLFSFEQINRIFSTLSEFPIDKSKYYMLESHLKLDYIISNFLKFNDKDFREVCSSKCPLNTLREFIIMFFDINSPIDNNYDIDLFWIYPRLELKLFLAHCISNKLYKEYFVSKELVNKLIEIISAFSWSEYKDLNKSDFINDNAINLPTLIYANIKLYEKGLLNLKESNNNIEITINPKYKDKGSSIFTKNNIFLKQQIVNVCNKTYNTSYSYSDFII